MQAYVTTSWDDGNRLDMKVYRLLEKYGLKGTFYVTLKKGRTLTENQIKKISKKHEIGAHTVNHKRLTDLSRDEALLEIINSKTGLERIIRSKVVAFAYPGGAHNAETRDMVKSCGFAYARTVKLFDFCLEDPLSVGVTVEAYKSNFIGVLKNLLTSGPIGLKFFLSKGLPSNWISLAKSTFDFVCKNGGVWHIYGHSKVIEELDLWVGLEEIFDYVSKPKIKSGGEVSYCTNSCTVARIGKRVR